MTTLRLKLTAFVAITALATAYTLITYAGIGADLFDPAYRVHVALPDAGGLFEHAEVTYRGVPIGRVEEISLTGAGARAVLRIPRAVRVPRAGTTATVTNRSGIGEQYLDLRPVTRTGPYLRDGDEIAENLTRLPVTTAAVLGDGDRLLASVDPGEVATVVDELDQAFHGAGPSLGRLIDFTDALLAEAEQVLPETIALVHDAGPVLRAQRAKGPDLRGLARDLASLTTALRAGEPDLRRVIDGATPAALAVERLGDGLRPYLPALLAELTVGAQTISARAHGLRQLLIGYPAGVASAFTVVDERGSVHFGLDLNLNVPRACTRGYEATGRRSPHDTTLRSALTGTSCKEPRESPTDVRGSRNTPAPLPTPGVPGHTGGPVRTAGPNSKE